MTIARADRVMLLASNVSGTSNEFQWLYRWLDDNAVVLGRQITEPHYQKVSVLKGDQLTREAFVTRIRILGKTVGVKAVDVFLNLHGLRDGVKFADGTAPIEDLCDELEDLDLGHRWRLLYSTCCWGALHAPHFVRAGFKTVSGSLGINANGPYDFPTQLTKWVGGSTYASALRAGNNQTMREIHDGLAELFGFDNVNSTKIIAGVKSLRITSAAGREPNPPRVSTRAAS
jgi:hypothetical protein